MSLPALQQPYKQHPLVHKAAQWLRHQHKGHLLLSGLHASARSMVLAELFAQRGQTTLLVADDADQAAYFWHDLYQLVEPAQVVSFPSPYRRRQSAKPADGASEIARAEVLNLLSRQERPLLVVTHPEALAEPVVSEQSLSSAVVRINRGMQLPIDSLEQQLFDLGFSRVDFVYEPGQYSVRGGIVDIFSYAAENPYRLDFFGDEVDSIRVFDIESQLSKRTCEWMDVLPELQPAGSAGTLLDYLPKDGLCVFIDLLFASGRIRQTNEDFPLDTLTNRDLTLEMAQKSGFASFDRISFDTQPQQAFHKNFDLLSDTLHQLADEGYSLCICADSPKQTDRLRAIFEDRGDNISFTPVPSALHEGFIDRDIRLACLTDHQIFERFHRVEMRGDNVRRGKVMMTLKELNQLKVGDYVVHINHGIGRFGGLVHTDVGGKMQEMIKLIYKDNGIIFVSIHSLHRISKYKGRDGEEPRLSRLGSGSWERLKERTKAKVKDIARDLIRLYARRRAEEGFAYSPDSYLQNELEASFLFEDTPDQARATAEVKHDMESHMPMDRLICGDVGFGKTEVAMRAAFKAAADSKQVAVLVPTTVLALQHYKSFSERFEGFPVTVEYLSRARSAAETRDLIRRLAEGRIDIIIGTHRLVGKQVKFKDLGLLIIDEEQRFGVAVKEKLRQLRANVDTLTLTATPIPRTLQFSLLGARDLSIINTPPPNRYPVQTEIISADDHDTIRDAIRQEMQRNGQVFFINNRIQSINTIENRLRRLVPEARIIVAHGQMPPDQLEERLLDFINYEYDVLIATSIIESGVDIPNVNTIFINEANRFGLSDLHQLRGRVGRSNRRASCYLIAPPPEVLTSDARRRLQAIESYAELGSGFNIAMQDLDIRGAGNMLGSEQSGFIADLGYETYQKILTEAMVELKNEEFADLYADQAESTASDTGGYVADCQLESDIDMGFPQTYIENTAERITLYRELDSLTTEEQLQAFTNRLTDRFGPVPPEGEELMQAVRLRRTVMQLGVERLVLKRGRMTFYLVSNPHSAYYQSDHFGALLNYMTQHPRQCRLREADGRRSVIFEPIPTVTAAATLVQDILTNLPTR